jgi:hypothetical protein
VKFFDALQTDDLSRVQDIIEKAFDKVDDTALLASNVVTTAVRGTDTPVFHGLGRPIRGWLVVRNSVVSIFCEGATSTNPSQFVNLKSSGGLATVTLLFF